MKKARSCSGKDSAEQRVAKVDDRQEELSARRLDSKVQTESFRGTRPSSSPETSQKTPVSLPPPVLR